MEYLLILAPAAFGLALWNALSLDRHYMAVHDRLREPEEAENAGEDYPYPARLTPGKSIPPGGSGQDQDLPEVPRWIRDWVDVMEGRTPGRLPEPGGGSAGDGTSSGAREELRAAIVYEFPAAGDGTIRDTGS